MIRIQKIIDFNKGIRAKFFLLFSLMGIIPFMILVVLAAVETVNEMEEAGKQNTQLKNTIISEHVTEIMEKNRCVLHVLALDTDIVEFVQNPNDSLRESVTKYLHNANGIFNDESIMGLTGADGWQLIRTDGATLVNLNRRQHFQEAMKGRSYVSDIISSMATGKLIVVMEVPVFTPEGKVVGMVQRNFEVTSVQNFVKTLDDEETSIIVMDRTGHVIANSDKDDTIGYEFKADENYKFILERIYNSSGVIHMDVDGVDSLATYSRNLETGWMIVTIRPYHYIMDQVYDKAAKALLFGMGIMLVGAALAWALTMRVTKPIIEMTNVVEEIADGNTSLQKIKVNTNDELGQMAAAFNKIRSERDAFQLESELDKLTELFNKKTMENLCRMKLKTFNENESANIFMAFYIVDLDHFKEVNDLLGHQFGDKVLIEFAKGLRKIFRPNDCIGRFGGDEYVVTVDNLPNMEVVLRKAEQIKQIAANLMVEGKTHFVTASIGIALAPQNGRDYESLFEAADKALYYVKRNGKNGYHFQDDEEENSD